MPNHFRNMKELYGTEDNIYIDFLHNVNFNV